MKLELYFQRHNDTIRAFARRSLLSAHTVRKVLRGKAIKPISAKKIIRVTKGLVNVDDLLVESPMERRYDEP